MYGCAALYPAPASKWYLASPVPGGQPECSAPHNYSDQFRFLGHPPLRSLTIGKRSSCAVRWRSWDEHCPVAEAARVALDRTSLLPAALPPPTHANEL